MKEELIRAIRDGKGFDFIGNNGYNFSKDFLVDIIKEYDYAIYDECANSSAVYKVVADAIEEII